MCSASDPTRTFEAGALTLAAIVAVAVLFVSGCTQDEIREARGILIDVQSREIQNADSFTLRDGTGNVLTFGVSPEVANNPEHPNSAAHLRQHMIAADPVVVRYRITTAGPVAVRVLDGATI